MRQTEVEQGSSRTWFTDSMWNRFSSAAPTQISQTMVDFLLELQDPEKNDRDWFQQHDAVYRVGDAPRSGAALVFQKLNFLRACLQYIWDNWNTFIENLLPRLMEVDETVPYLPTKDMVYRI